MIEFGIIKKVDIKTIWKHEALNFTPWLADNLEKLSELIGIDLELISREAEVGDFSLDLLARDLSTNRNVIIENQFNPTDHRHLGQLITYASYYKANVIIWISEEVREEHRAAIDWLNINTNSEIEFFAVEISVIQIDNSKPALNFKIKANPNEWQKSSKKSFSGENTETQNAYAAFFQKVIDELREKHRFTSARAGQPQNWYTFTSGVRGFGYSASFGRAEKVRVEIYIDFGNAEKNKEVLYELKEGQIQIEKEFGENLEWDEIPNKRACRIAVYRQGSIEDDPSTLIEIHDWVVAKLLRFKTVFENRLKKYKK